MHTENNDKLCNQGYEITDRISIGTQHYVLAYNPNAPAPYVTWSTDSTFTSFYFGHYMTSRESALLDLFRRACESLKIPVTAFLNDQEKLDIYHEVLTTIHKSEIAQATDHIAGPLHITEKGKENILANHAFMEDALQIWNRLGEPPNEEDLQMHIQNLLMEKHTHLLPNISSMALKLPPEQIRLINDLLGKTGQEIGTKYGPFDQDLEYMFDFTPGITGILTVKIPEVDKSVLQLDLFQKGLPIASTVHLPDQTSIIGSFVIADHTGKRYTMSIEEDPTLRRVGNLFQFHTSSPDEDLCSHNGQTCTVLRQLQPKQEYDALITGLMYEVSFEDGSTEHVYDYELHPIDRSITIEQLADFSEEPFSVELIDNTFYSSGVIFQPGEQYQLTGIVPLGIDGEYAVRMQDDSGNISNLSPDTVCKYFQRASDPVKNNKLSLTEQINSAEKKQSTFQKYEKANHKTPER